MNILPILQNSGSFKLIQSAAGKNQTSALFGAYSVHCAAYAAALHDSLSRPVIIVTDSDAEAAKMAADITVLSGTRTASFPSRDFTFIDVEGVSHDLEIRRLSVLGQILSKRVSVITASVEAYSQYTIPKADFKKASLSIKQGERISQNTVLSHLLSSGYTRSARVEGKGQFAQRGGILDVFPADRENPVRIEFFGDEVESMTGFDPGSQRSVRTVSAVSISPARETLLGEKESAIRLLNDLASNVKPELKKVVLRDIEHIGNDIMPPATDRYLPYCYDQKENVADYFENAVTIFFEPAALRSRARTLAQQHWDDIAELVEKGLYKNDRNEFYKQFDMSALRGSAVYAAAFARTGVAESLSEMININASTLPRFTGEFAPLLQDIKGYLANGFAVGVLAPTARAANNIKTDLLNEGITAFSQENDEDIKHGTVTVGVGALTSGFEIPGLKFALFTGTKAMTKKKAEQRKTKVKNAFGSLEDLRAGDYVVHKNHGIGMFDGIHRIDHHGLVRDYIKIKYRGADILYLPVTQLDMVTQYITPKGVENPPLAKLHSGEWQKTKKNIYRSVREMAKELIELYARREKSNGVAFSEDGEWQRDFEARFIYEETNDQLRAADEIKLDMQKISPMDRLLCGDVGVGKTEVALRAAFKCVVDGYQCAVLVPTTILAWQHLNTFLERMETYPIKTVMLSRFSTAGEIRSAIEGIKNGTADIAIGTHRLLQKDVNFKKLGLLIVDEEQRFGVGHKEKLKQKFTGVDVLTLSATPIPRTLNMAMSGLRDMSIIEDPPEDRHPVQTFVIEYDMAIVRDAIEREIGRGGQVFYLHNRVQTIDRVAFELREMCPDARVETAHGQMSEDDLSGVWRRMNAGDVDVLCCTTIIETGVDVSNCNTLIVEDSDRLGLAQLYQIRGRVGRSNRRAFAYFTFRRDSVLSETASRRLSAIRDFTSFGSGFKIAMRDLQIRGAGGILSARQSGHMQAVGYDTYIDILNEAIEDEKGVTTRKKKTECVVDIAVDAYIPETYIPDSESRIEMYKRIAAIETKEDADDVLNEMKDRFGRYPISVNGLVSVALVRSVAETLEIYEITQRQDSILLYSDSIEPAAVMRLIDSKARRILVSSAGKSYISIGVEREELVIDALVETLDIMTEKP